MNPARMIFRNALHGCFFLLLTLPLPADDYLWKFTASEIGGKSLKTGSAPIGELSQEAKWDDGASLKLDGKQHVIFPEKTARRLFSNQFTITARVRVDQPDPLGGVVTFIQDNGSYERGLILGFTKNRFSFIFSNGDRFQKVVSAKVMPLHQWVVLAVSYDGETARVYQDGQQIAMGPVKGKVVLPDIATPFVVGAFKDKDQFYGVQGAVSFVSIAPRAMTPGEIREAAVVARAGITFAVRPNLRYTGENQAQLSWYANASGSATVAFGVDKKNLDRTATSSAEGREHTLTLSNLLRGRKYYYRIGMKVAGKRLMGRVHEFDTALNYLPPTVAASSAISPQAEAHLKTLLEYAKSHPAGYAIVLGITDGDLVMALAKSTQLNIFAIDPDPKRIQALRKKAYAAKIYGRRITTLQMEGDIPVTVCMANLILSERALAGETPTVSITEAKRILRPSGGAIVVPDNDATKKWGGAELTASGKMLVHLREKLPGSKDWSHQYGNAANTTYTGEEMGGASSATDLRLQWLGRPGADFNIDRQPRTPAPLAVNGRLFHQGMNRIIALDAYNGAVLWSMEVSDLRRLNIPHDCSNWCADEKNLYVVVEETAWVVDALSGKVKKYLEIPAKVRDSHLWGFIANEGDQIVGSGVRIGSNFKDFWGCSMWFEGAGRTLAITQVCSDSLFGYDKKSLKNNWVYTGGMMINSTISLKNGSIYFLENRSSQWADAPNGRISDRSLWLDLHAVCLDAKTGKKRWEKQLPPFKYVDAEKGFIQSAYGLNSDDGYMLVFSESELVDDKFKGRGHFVYHYLNSSNGQLKWSSQTPWYRSHHSAHFSHPIIKEDIVYTDPYVVKLADGQVLPEMVKHRQKCTTPVAWKNGYLFRGRQPGFKSITLVMWDKNKNAVTGWNRLRPSCWLNVLPAQGGLLIPEGGGGCSCGGWMETSVGFLPAAITKSNK
jgi:outer membrane protein assembly factor BamB